MTRAGLLPSTGAGEGSLRHIRHPRALLGLAKGPAEDQFLTRPLRQQGR